MGEKEGWGRKGIKLTFLKEKKEKKEDYFKREKF